MKLKVLKPYFDKKESKYVYPAETPIEREKARGAELIAAGVAEEYSEEPEQSVPAETVTETAEIVAEAEVVAETKPARRGKK